MGRRNIKSILKVLKIKLPGILFGWCVRFRLIGYHYRAEDTKLPNRFRRRRRQKQRTNKNQLKQMGVTKVIIFKKRLSALAKTQCFNLFNCKVKPIVIYPTKTFYSRIPITFYIRHRHRFRFYLKKKKKYPFRRRRFRALRRFAILLRFGFFYNVLILLPKSIILFWRKRFFILHSPYLEQIIAISQYIRFTRNLFPYKRKGFAFEDELITLKIGKKVKYR